MKLTRLLEDIQAGEIYNRIFEIEPDFMSAYGDEYVYSLIQQMIDEMPNASDTDIIGAVINHEEDEHLASQAPEEDPYASEKFV